MFRYPTSYRCYTLAKIGFSLAYIWYVSDFFRIHVAIWNQLALLLPDPRNIVLSGNSPRKMMGKTAITMAKFTATFLAVTKGPLRSDQLRLG